MGVLHKQPPFQNVAAGQVANLPNLNMGDTCDMLLFKLGGTFTVSQINGIRAKLGGKTIVDDLSGSQLSLINDYMGRVTSTTFLAIHFADINARTITGENIGSIDTSLGYTSFTLEVDIDAGAIAPTLECWMLKSPPKVGVDKGVFKSYLKSVETFGAANTFNLSPAVGSAVGNLINRLHLFHANITRLDVKKNGLEILGDGEIAVVEFLQDELNRTTQAGLLVYDPLFDNNQSNSVSTVKPDGSVAPMEFRATLSAGDTITEISELYSSIATI